MNRWTCLTKVLVNDQWMCIHNRLSLSDPRCVSFQLFENPLVEAKDVSLVLFMDLTKEIKTNVLS